MRRPDAALGLLLTASLAAGGDYRLVVADDPKDPCVPAPAASGRAGWPVVSAQEVSEDLLRHSRGEPPKLELFLPAFTNARITFCKPGDRRKVYETLVAALRLTELRNEWDFYDYCLMLGSPELVSMLDAAIEAERSDRVVKRIRRARAAVLKGIDARSRRR